MTFQTGKYAYFALLSISISPLACDVKPTGNRHSLNIQSNHPGFDSADNESVAADEEVSEAQELETKTAAEAAEENKYALIGHPALFLLTKNHIVRTLVDVFPRPEVVKWTDFDTVIENSQRIRYENVRGAIQDFAGYFANYWSVFDTITNRLIAEDSPVTLVTECLPTTPDTPCIAEILDYYGKRLFRRTLTDTERNSYLESVGAQYSADYDDATNSQILKVGIKYMIMNLLMSPNFLYQTYYGDESGKLKPLEYASRISFFLTKKNPDETLIDLASEGKIYDDGIIEAQLNRLLNDAENRNYVFTEFFTQSWGINLADESSTAQVAADDYQRLKPHLIKEFEMTAKDIVSTYDGDWTMAFTGPFTFVNKTLAEHYYDSDRGIGTNDDWVKIEDDMTRSGLMTTGMAMAAHSGGKYNSSVHRGLFILETLQCKSVSGTPENVQELIEASGIDLSDMDSVHQRITKRVENPVCGACHQHIDPLGLVMENYDSFGKFFEERYGEPVVTETKIDNITFSTLPGLAEHLITDAHTAQCFYDNLFSFASGFEINHDAPAFSESEKATIENSRNFFDLVKHVIRNENFYKIAKDE